MKTVLAILVVLATVLFLGCESSDSTPGLTPTSTNTVQAAGTATPTASPSPTTTPTPAPTRFGIVGPSQTPSPTLGLTETPSPGPVGSEVTPTVTPPPTTAPGETPAPSEEPVSTPTENPGSSTPTLPISTPTPAPTSPGPTDTPTTPPATLTPTTPPPTATPTPTSAPPTPTPTTPAPTATPTTSPPTATPTSPPPTPIPTPTTAPPPTTFNVTTTADGADANPGNGFCAAANGACTLRAAVQEANAQGSQRTVNLPSGTYVLAGGVIEVTGTVSIVGQSSVTIDAQGRAFHVLPGGDLRLNTMTIQNGGVGESLSNGPILGGGNILNQGSLTIQSALIRDGYSDVIGGNIANHGSMSLTDATISGGGVQYVGGAGIYNAPGANATITRAGIRDNLCSHAAQGGGVLNRGTMSIIDSTLEGNVSVDGSNVNNEGNLTIRGSRFIGGPDDEFQPGGISNDGTINDEGGNEIS